VLPHDAPAFNRSTMPSPNTQASPAIDAFEFEVIDIDSARHELDALPAGITQRPGYWTQKRRQQAATDRALTGATIDWMVSLPDAVRPKHLCEQFPRVANTVASMWRDKTRSLVMMDRLMHDDRNGTRRGFPEPVMYDLGVLVHYRQKIV
jgi:hypothetical protein